MPEPAPPSEKSETRGETRDFATRCRLFSSCLSSQKGQSGPKDVAGGVHVSVGLMAARQTSELCLGDARLEEIEARWKAATPGPWKLNQPDYSAVVLDSHAWPVARVDTDRGRNEAHTNADFIAHARSDILFLLSTVRALRAELEEAEKKRDESTAKDVYRRTSAALDATCRREEAEREALDVARDALVIVNKWEEAPIWLHALSNDTLLALAALHDEGGEE